MNKFIILVLALLCASTIAFRFRQGGPPPGAPCQEGEDCEEFDFPCELPADDATEEALDEFMACLDDTAMMFEEIAEGACGAFPEMDATDEEAETFFACIEAESADIAADYEPDTTATRRVQHKRRIQQQRRMQNMMRRN